MREMTIAEIRQTQISILKAVTEYCDKNNLTYYLAGGSLLGAVRHNGYIPWDDDIDLFMPREDYEKFFQFFNLNREDSFKAIHIENDPDYYLVMGKVIDLKTTLIENVGIAKPIGVFLDIFPLDVFPDNKNMLRQVVRRTGFLRKILSLKSIKLRKGRTWYKQILLILIHITLMPVPVRFIIKHISKESQKYNNTADCTRTAAMVMLTYGEREIFYKEDFEDRCRLSFEDGQYWAPKNYDRVLTQLYGNYMELPPIEKQVTHHDNKAYWRE